MKRPILTHPNPVLAQKSAPVESIDDEVRALVVDMLDTLYASGGIGLAAPQIGVLRRVVVVDLGPPGRRQPYILINPELAKPKGAMASTEGCLSIPGKLVNVPRAKSVEMMFLDLSGHSSRIKASGLLAACFQHEVDHLDGVLLVDHEMASS